MNTVIDNVRSVPREADRDAIWNIYHDAISAVRSRAVVEQLLFDKSAIEKLLDDPGFTKFLARESGEVKAFVIATDDMERARINFVNPEFLKSTYPNMHADKKIFYVTIMAVHPKDWKKGFSKVLVTHIAKFFIDNNASMVLDVSSNINGHLPALFAQVAQAIHDSKGPRTKEASATLLGSQEYWIVKIC